MKSSEFAQDAINKARQGKKRKMADEPERKRKNEVMDEKRAKAIFLKILIFSMIFTVFTCLFSIIGSCSQLFQQSDTKKNTGIKYKNNMKHQTNIKYKNEKRAEKNNKDDYEIEKPEKVTYRKKEIAKYIVYFKNGSKISCKNTPDIKNGMIVITENRITTKIPASELVKIEGVWH